MNRGKKVKRRKHRGITVDPVPKGIQARTSLKEALQRAVELRAEVIRRDENYVNMVDCDREWLVDAGAAFHVIGWQTLSNSERRSVRKDERRSTVKPASGSAEVLGTIDVYLRVLDLTIAATVLRDTPCALSVGQLMEDFDIYLEWTDGGLLVLKKQCLE